MRHTWSFFMIRCVNMKWIWLVLWNIHSRYNSIHRQTDGRTYWRMDRQCETSTPPFIFIEVRGIITDDTKDSIYMVYCFRVTLQWRHTGREGISNHQPDNCLLNRLFRRRSKETSKLCVTGLYAGNSPHKWPVMRKMFPFDDVIMHG